MTDRLRYLGVIVDLGGMLCLQTAPRIFYPLKGNSGIAEDFQNDLGGPFAHDVDKRVYRHPAGHLCMENAEQRDARQAFEAAGND